VKGKRVEYLTLSSFSDSIAILTRLVSFLMMSGDDCLSSPSFVIILCNPSFYNVSQSNFNTEPSNLSGQFSLSHVFVFHLPVCISPLLISKVSPLSHLLLQNPSGVVSLLARAKKPPNRTTMPLKIETSKNPPYCSTSFPLIGGPIRVASALSAKPMPK
jgi:hypothetical protein